MYSWGDDMEDWAKPAAYKFDAKTAVARKADAERSKSEGPRTYTKKGTGPNVQLTDPKKHISTQTKTPLIVAVDVTGSMQTWPAEIFDRLPLLYQTLSQYKPELEISFAAIGDTKSDRWPLQVTKFSKGFDLEEQLKAIYGEGGGGDIPESYGVFASWALNHVEIPKLDERPFMIVFGDAPMHPKIFGGEAKQVLGDDIQDADSVTTWINVTRTWNVFFLRRPGGKKGDATDQQWIAALGDQQVVHMEDEGRAVDYAMGLIARSWGFYGDFQENMRARQDDAKVAALAAQLAKVSPKVVTCPQCGAPLRGTAALKTGARVTCVFCQSIVQLP